MPALFIAQMALIAVAVACFCLWAWTLFTDPHATAEEHTEGGEPGITGSRFSPFVFFGVMAASLWLLSQTQFDLCAFLSFWWRDMPSDLYRWSCVAVPKMP